MGFPLVDLCCPSCKIGAQPDRRQCAIIEVAPSNSPWNFSQLGELSPPSRVQASLFVPTTAVVRTSERQLVVRIRNGAAEWVDVRRGEVNGSLVEVFGDLREGDVVAQRGNDEIRPGMKIAQAGASR
jgi:hypothetical protein